MLYNISAYEVPFFFFSFFVWERDIRIWSTLINIYHRKMNQVKQWSEFLDPLDMIWIGNDIAIFFALFSRCVQATHGRIALSERGDIKERKWDQTIGSYNTDDK